MDERVVQFRVGLMVLASLLITGILVMLFGELPRFIKEIFKPTYAVRLWFPEGRGLAENGLVRRNGILVGRVTKVRFAEEEKDLELPPGLDEAEYYGGVVVTVEIQDDMKLYENDVCSIQTDLLGKPSLQFVRPEDEPPTTDLLDTGRLHRGRISPDPLDSISAVTKTLSKVTPSINKASKALENAAQDISRLVTANESAIQGAVAQAEHTLENISKLAENVNSLLGDEQTQGELKAALKELPGTLAQTRIAMMKAQQRLDEMQTFTETLGSQEMADRLNRTTSNLDRVMQDLPMLTKSLSDPKGSLGLLLHDRQLYDHLNNVAENIDNLSRQLQPILNDVRVFTDKIARHPEMLGARGVLQKYPGIK